MGDSSRHQPEAGMETPKGCCPTTFQGTQTGWADGVIDHCLRVLDSDEFRELDYWTRRACTGERTLTVRRGSGAGLLGAGCDPASVTITSAGLCYFSVLFKPPEITNLRPNSGANPDLTLLTDTLRKLNGGAGHGFCPGFQETDFPARFPFGAHGLIVLRQPFVRVQAEGCPVVVQLNTAKFCVAGGRVDLQLCPHCEGRLVDVRRDLRKKGKDSSWPVFARFLCPQLPSLSRCFSVKQCGSASVSKQRERALSLVRQTDKVILAADGALSLVRQTDKVILAADQSDRAEERLHRPSSSTLVPGGEDSNGSNPGRHLIESSGDIGTPSSWVKSAAIKPLQPVLPSAKETSAMIQRTLDVPPEKQAVCPEAMPRPPGTEPESPQRLQSTHGTLTKSPERSVMCSDTPTNSTQTPKMSSQTSVSETMARCSRATASCSQTLTSSRALARCSETVAGPPRNMTTPSNTTDMSTQLLQVSQAAVSLHADTPSSRPKAGSPVLTPWTPTSRACSPRRNLTCEGAGPKEMHSVVDEPAAKKPCYTRPPYQEAMATTTKTAATNSKAKANNSDARMDSLSEAEQRLPAKERRSSLRKTKHPRSARSVTCKECSRSFISGTKFAAHVSVHMSNVPHMCDLCCKLYRREKDYREHMARHRTRGGVLALLEGKQKAARDIVTKAKKCLVERALMRRLPEPALLVPDRLAERRMVSKNSQPINQPAQLSSSVSSSLSSLRSSSSCVDSKRSPPPCFKLCSSFGFSRAMLEQSIHEGDLPDQPTSGEGLSKALLDQSLFEEGLSKARQEQPMHSEGLGKARQEERARDKGPLTATADENPLVGSSKSQISRPRRPGTSGEDLLCPHPVSGGLQSSDLHGIHNMDDSQHINLLAGQTVPNYAGFSATGNTPFDQESLQTSVRGLDDRKAMLHEKQFPVTTSVSLSRTPSTHASLPVRAEQNYVVNVTEIKDTGNLTETSRLEPVSLHSFQLSQPLLNPPCQSCRDPEALPIPSSSSTDAAHPRQSQTTVYHYQSDPSFAPPSRKDVQERLETERALPMSYTKGREVREAAHTEYSKLCRQQQGNHNSTEHHGHLYRNELNAWKALITNALVSDTARKAATAFRPITPKPSPVSGSPQSTSTTALDQHPGGDEQDGQHASLREGAVDTHVNFEPRSSASSNPGTLVAHSVCPVPHTVLQAIPFTSTHFGPSPGPSCSQELTAEQCMSSFKHRQLPCALTTLSGAPSAHTASKHGSSQPRVHTTLNLDCHESLNRSKDVLLETMEPESLMRRVVGENVPSPQPRRQSYPISIPPSFIHADVSASCEHSASFPQHGHLYSGHSVYCNSAEGSSGEDRGALAWKRDMMQRLGGKFSGGLVHQRARGLPQTVPAQEMRRLMSLGERRHPVHMLPTRPTNAAWDGMPSADVPPPFSSPYETRRSSGHVSETQNVLYRLPLNSMHSGRPMNATVSSPSQPCLSVVAGLEVVPPHSISHPPAPSPGCVPRPSSLPLVMSNDVPSDEVPMDLSMRDRRKSYVMMNDERYTYL